MVMMRIEFTDFAKSELQNIYNYYLEVASQQTALKIIDKILDEIEKLQSLPTIGSEEFLLKRLKKEHRYIVYGNYKIIFRRTEKVIYITDIFDCRQNPEKILERNK